MTLPYNCFARHLIALFHTQTLVDKRNSKYIVSSMLYVTAFYGMFEFIIEFSKRKDKKIWKLI